MLFIACLIPWLLIPLQTAPQSAVDDSLAQAHDRFNIVSLGAISVSWGLAWFGLLSAWFFFWLLQLYLVTDFVVLGTWSACNRNSNSLRIHHLLAMSLVSFPLLACGQPSGKSEDCATISLLVASVEVHTFAMIVRRYYRLNLALVTRGLALFCRYGLHPLALYRSLQFCHRHQCSVDMTGGLFVVNVNLLLINLMNVFFRDKLIQ